ncbi:isoprenoid synthase domain-containing protein [Suillus bovinus]|uniref:isoprenoid synthase domain-containing protein n=1 Tax=Suillus bovinus TaxID=48563 RepID=UPI001B861ACD|nr:isoprenoid synthase domain-containing protein [Suillus bovinus]KAG2146059.1 isoprenoid synthase domain-containing protein [Suillus bovinus]
MTTNNLSTSTLDGKVLANIRQSIAEFLQRCGLQYKKIPLDEAWCSECYQEVIKRGYPMDDILPYIAVGVAMVSNAYDHLPDRASKMWMCLFTTLLACIDDKMITPEYMVHAYRFNEQFVNCQPQGHPLMNALDGLLREVTCHHSAPVSNFVVTSSLDFVSSLLLDIETKDMPISRQNPSYPEYARLLSGVEYAYAYYIFPSTVPLREYVQCMPDLAIVINHTNDILSYYKEEIEGDSANYLSLITASRGLTKQEALSELIEKTMKAHHSILEFLKPRPEVHDAYAAFFDGYVKFHATFGRYKLDAVPLTFLAPLQLQGFYENVCVFPACPLGLMNRLQL